MNRSNSDWPPSEPASDAQPNPPTIHAWSRGLLITVVSMALLVGVTGGLLLSTAGPIQTWLNRQPALVSLTNPADASSAGAFDIKRLWEVRDLVRSQHIDGEQFTDQQLFYGALQGLVRSTDDPYSDFFTPDEAKQLSQEVLAGEFEGIGAEIGKKADQIIVITPLAGSPAETAGLRSGDSILSIDDQLTAGLRLDEAIQLIRGERGSVVKLLVLHEDSDTPAELSITRDTIKQTSVEVRMVERRGLRIAVIEIHQFTQDTAKAFQEAVNSIVLDQPAGLVVDVRGNPGGILSIAVDVASFFLVEGAPVVIEQSVDGTETIKTASGSAPLQGIPTVVLMNQSSASAAEILAGALHDHDQATLLGTTTYGKGTVQQLFPLSDSSIVKLTVEHWLTPDHTVINEHGVDPDYWIDAGKDDFPGEQDTQLDAALQYLVNPEQFQEKHQPYVRPTDEVAGTQ